MAEAIARPFVSRYEPALFSRKRAARSSDFYKLFSDFVIVIAKLSLSSSDSRRDSAPKPLLKFLSLSRTVNPVRLRDTLSVNSDRSTSLLTSLVCHFIASNREDVHVYAFLIIERNDLFRGSATPLVLSDLLA